MPILIILCRLLLEAQEPQKVLVLLEYLFDADRLQHVCREDWLQTYDKEVGALNSRVMRSSSSHMRNCRKTKPSGSDWSTRRQGEQCYRLPAGFYCIFTLTR